jgi:hypothetical protein
LFCGQKCSHSNSLSFSFFSTPIETKVVRRRIYSCSFPRILAQRFYQPCGAVQRFYQPCGAVQRIRTLGLRALKLANVSLLVSARPIGSPRVPTVGSARFTIEKRAPTPSMSLLLEQVRGGPHSGERKGPPTPLGQCLSSDFGRLGEMKSPHHPLFAPIQALAWCGLYV